MTVAPHRTHEPPGDVELLAAVAAGDLPALGQLFDRHEPSVRRYLCRMGVSSADVDDLVQATFIEITAAACRFEGQAARSWIFGVASIMLRRHRRSLSRAAARLSAWSSLPRRVEATPVELIERDETFLRFERAFRALPSKKREAFVLVTLEGLTGEEAAAVLGVPINTVWTRLHHARLALRAAIEAENP